MGVKSDSELKKQFDRLPDDVRFLLRRSDGFLDLNMLRNARKELDAVPEAYRASAPFRRQQMRYALVRESWDDVASLAEGLKNEIPDELEFRITFGCAIRRTRGVEAARLALRDALAHFPDAPIVSYNLGCYECLCGNTEEALIFVTRAMAADHHFREHALEDEDLRIVWGVLERL